ncbi:ABC transporter permease [Embleya sp. NPDC127516]|uniref:ABC transporter permease n=1 Tax=Embleya sp. NPDC127516 TaxID=3363990 RepID=UPI003804A5AA
MKTLKNGVKGLLYILGLPVGLLALAWWMAARSDSFYYPTLDEVLTAFGDTWFSARIVDDVLPSLARLAVGYLGAVLIGVSLGVLLGSHRRSRALLEPVLEFFRAIPPPVLIPVLMLFSGIGDTMKVAVIIAGSVWPVLLNTIEGVRAIDDVLVDTARCYRITGAARLRRLVLPAASPQIVVGMRQALSISLILMVISEMFASSNGVGFAIVQFQRSFAIPEMWSGILLLGLLGFALSLLFRLFESRVLGWYHGLRRSQRGER